MTPTKPAAPVSGHAASDGDLNARAKRIQELVARIETTGDPATRALVQELLQSVLQLHATGLGRMLEIVGRNDKEPAGVRRRLLDDKIVRGLLLIHDLHPEPLPDRLQQALAKVLPYIRSHGGNVELISLHDGVANLRLEGTCKTCSASTITLELAVRAAIEEFCPDLAGFNVEGVEEATTPAPYASCSEPAVAAAT